MQERIWLCYLVAVIGLAAVADGGGDPAHAPGACLLALGALLVLNLGLLAGAARLPPNALRACRSLLAMAGLPIVFTAMAFLLPAVHPEGYEWRMLAIDRACLGADVTVALQGLPRAVVELLQLCYTSFYVLPIAAVLLAPRGGGAAAFDRSQLVVVTTFLLSYLGYLLWPVLPPYRILHHELPLEGLWLCAPLRAWIDAAEANRWDCFPSGHTLVAVVAAVMVRRHQPRALWWFLPVTVLLVFSTMALRYHWAIDVAVGLALVWPCLRVGDWLSAAASADRPAN